MEDVNAVVIMGRVTSLKVKEFSTWTSVSFLLDYGNGKVAIQVKGAKDKFISVLEEEPFVLINGAYLEIRESGGKMYHNLVTTAAKMSLIPDAEENFTPINRAFFSAKVDEVLPNNIMILRENYSYKDFKNGNTISKPRHFAVQSPDCSSAEVEVGEHVTGEGEVRSKLDGEFRPHVYAPKLILH